MIDIHTDDSPEEHEFRLFCWLHRNRHLAHGCSLFEALSVFASEIPTICSEKISCGEDADHFRGILGRLRSKDRSGNRGLDIQRAKEYPIMRLAEELTGEPVRMGKIRHPRERTASIHLYPDRNRYYDFGRNVGGDTIDLAMLFLSVDMKEAVKRLT